MLKDKCYSFFVAVAAVAMITSLYLVFLYAPTERTMGVIQRIFYFHLSSAWVGFLAFFGAFMAGISYLLRRQWLSDVTGVASVEIGIVFSTIAIVTGSIWARPVWNTWWTWDPRLTTTLVMWMYYVSSLLLRQMVEGEERPARFTALLSIIGFVNVPVVFMAIRLWRTIHPVILTTQGFALEPRMLLTLLVCLLSFTLLYLCLLLLRIRVGSLRLEIDKLKMLLSSVS